MDPTAMRMMALGFTGAAIAAVSAWLAIRGKDGSGWAIVATLLLIATCSQGN